MARIVSTSGLQTTTGLPILALIAGLRTSRYQPKPYDVLATTVAAIVSPSDSLTRATPAITQKPMNVRVDKMIVVGIIPSGMLSRPAMKDTAATTNVNHGTRNIPTVETVFAIVY